MEDRRAVGTATMSLYNSYEFYFGPRKENAMRYDFSDDPYYQTAKEEKAEMERLEALQDEAREEYDREYLSECDACGQMKYGCEDLVYLGMDTHACAGCRGEDKD